MKNAFLTMALILSAGFANAAEYDCKLSNGDANDPKAVTYTFDTATENNKFVDLGDGTAVGCVVLKAQTPLVSCGLGDGANFSIFTIADEGTSILALDTNSHGAKANLTCVKKL